MAAEHVPQQRHEISHPNTPAAGDRSFEYLANAIEHPVRTGSRQGRRWPRGEDLVEHIEGEHRLHARASTAAAAAA